MSIISMFQGGFASRKNWLTPLDVVLRDLPDHPINKITELFPQNWRTPIYSPLIVHPLH